MDARAEARAGQWAARLVGSGQHGPEASWFWFWFCHLAPEGATAQPRTAGTQGHPEMGGPQGVPVFTAL